MGTFGEPKHNISGPQRFKHHQNSTRRHPERYKKSETVAGEGKKKSEILGGPVEGPWRGGSRGRGSSGGGVGGSQTNNTPWGHPTLERPLPRTALAGPSSAQNFEPFFPLPRREREERKVWWEWGKSAKFLAPHLSGPHPLSSHTSGPPPPPFGEPGAEEGGGPPLLGGGGRGSREGRKSFRRSPPPALPRALEIWTLFSASSWFLAVPVLCLGVACVSLVRLWTLVHTSAGGFWTIPDYATRGWTSDLGTVLVRCSASRWRLRNAGNWISVLRAVLGSTVDANSCVCLRSLWLVFHTSPT